LDYTRIPAGNRQGADRGYTGRIEFIEVVERSGYADAFRFSVAGTLRGFDRVVKVHSWELPGTEISGEEFDKLSESTCLGTPTGYVSWDG